MHVRNFAQRGYSLAEALVVVAIIGLISIIAVPNFMQMYQSAKIKGAIRQFTNDLRYARQEAVTRYRPMMISLGTSTAEQHSYWIYQWDGSAWLEICQTPQGYRPCADLPPDARRAKRDLEPDTALPDKTISFNAIGFPDSVSAGGGSRRDIIFETTGAIRNPPVTPTVTLQSNQNIGKPTYLITVYPSGSVKAE